MRRFAAKHGLGMSREAAEVASVMGGRLAQRAGALKIARDASCGTCCPGCCPNGVRRNDKRRGAAPSTWRRPDSKLAVPFRGIMKAEKRRRPSSADGRNASACDQSCALAHPATRDGVDCASVVGAHAMGREYGRARMAAPDHGTQRASASSAASPPSEFGSAGSVARSSRGSRAPSALARPLSSHGSGAAPRVSWRGEARADIILPR
jgi:hypothetical protein